jgi:hypothetical protein
MKYILTLLIAIVITNINSQNKQDWSKDFRLKFEDFKSGKGVEIDKNATAIQLIPGNFIDFNYSMTKAEFMFTKNFNSKVTSYWFRNSSVLIAPDSTTAYDLLAFSQYFFDLTELYTRRFRKEMYESKAVFSGTDFYKKAYEKMIESLSQKFSEDVKITNYGKDKFELKYLTDKVNLELIFLEDYCKTCKPKKKK